MTQATRHTPYVDIFSNSAAANPRKIVQAVFTAAVMLVLLGNAAVAQYYEDDPVTIAPKMLAVAEQSTDSKPVATGTVDSNSQQPSAAPSTQNQTTNSIVVLPPGTSVPLGLVRPLTLKQSTAQGAGVYLQVTFPVTVAGRMVVPPGAYVQGTIKKLTINHGADPDLEFELQAAKLIFSTGYTVPLTGTVELVHKTALAEPGIGEQSAGQPMASLIPVGKTNLPPPIMSAVGGPAPPPLPPLPSMGNGVRNLAIIGGVIVGGAAIAGVALAFRHHNDVYLDAGTPLEIILSEPLTLDANYVNSAVQLYSAQMATNPPDIVKPPKMCYDPGTAGTPDTVIPGIPPSPPTVIPGMNGAPDTVIPGSPGTPDTVIPGTPGTAGGWHKCS